MRATTLLALLLACAFARAPELARARTVLPARGHVELAAGPRSMTDDCDACRTFMKAVERQVSRGKIQGEMAAAIAEMCEEATHGETSQMSVCVAAGEAGLRFATRYLENHPELGDRACRALEMCDDVRAMDSGEESVVRSMGARETRAVRAAAANARTVADDETCADCVMASNLLANELRSNTTSAFVVSEVDALCTALGTELAAECDALIEPYVPVLLNALADKLKDACTKMGICSENER